MPRKLLIFLGLVLIALGAGLAQLSVQKPGSLYSYYKVLLTPSNSSLTIELGQLEKGTRLEATWWSTPAEGEWNRAAIQVSAINAVTKEQLRWRTLGIEQTVIIDDGGGAIKNAPTRSEILQTANYMMTVSLPGEEYQSSEMAPPGTPTLISFLKVQVTPPASYPYQTLGLAMIGGGIAVAIIGMLLRKRKS